MMVDWGMISLVVVQVLLTVACVGVFVLIFPHLAAIRDLGERISKIEAAPRERVARMDSLDERITGAERSAERAIDATKSLRGSVAALTRWVKQQPAETTEENELERLIRESSQAPAEAPVNNGLRPGFGAQPGKRG